MHRGTRTLLPAILLVAALAGCVSSVPGSAAPAPGAATEVPPSASASSTATRLPGTPQNPLVTVRKKVAGLDLCPLVTNADIQKLTGQPVQTRRLDDIMCIYVIGPAELDAVSVLSDITLKEAGPATGYELGGNTAARLQEADACTAMVFTQPWDSTKEEVGQGLLVTVYENQRQPTPLDRCALATRLLQIAFDRLPASG